MSLKYEPSSEDILDHSEVQEAPAETLQSFTSSAVKGFSRGVSKKEKSIQDKTDVYCHRTQNWGCDDVGKSCSKKVGVLVKTYLTQCIY